MDDVAAITTEVAESDGPSSRRRMIAALLAGGAAAVVAPTLLSRASAATGGADPADVAALNAALAREASIVGQYATVVKDVSGADNVAALTLIHDHHLAYAQALKGYLGPKAADPAGSFQRFVDGTGTLSGVAKSLKSLEESVVKAHLSTLAGLKSHDAATLLASIITVEGRHVAALSILGGESPAVAAGI